MIEKEDHSVQTIYQHFGVAGFYFLFLFFKILGDLFRVGQENFDLGSPPFVNCHGLSYLKRKLAVCPSCSSTFCQRKKQKHLALGYCNHSNKKLRTRVCTGIPAIV